MDSGKHNSSMSMGAFMLIWVGQAFSLFGSQLVQFALIWWLTSETGSGTVLATASLVGILPQVVLGPFIGPFVDRWNRRRTLIGADALVALATLVLMGLFMADIVQLWHIYVAMFLRALSGSFHWPAMNASMSLMVPEKHLARVQGLNQTLQGALGIVSAPLAALLLSTLPISGILAIDITTAAIAILPLLFTFIPQPEKTEAEGTAIIIESKSYWDDLKAGLRYIWGWPGLIAILVMAMLINLTVTPAFTLLPLLVTNHFGGDALQLGWLEASFGIGMVLGGLLLGVWGGFKKKIITTLSGLIANGIVVLLLGITPASMFVMAVISIFLTGLTIPIINGPIQAVFQVTVEPEMQGRVFSLVASLTSAMTPVGLMVAGPLSDAMNVQTWFVIAGGTMLLAGFSGFFIPIIMNLEADRIEAEDPLNELETSSSIA